MAWHLEFTATGTTWKIDVFDATRSSAAVLNTALENQIRERINQFEQHYSRFRADSLLSQMSKTPSDYILPADGEMLFNLYQELYTLTNGLFTPLIGKVLVDAGYDPEYSLKPKKLSPPASWAETIDYQFPRFTMKQPAQLDVGAAGKGHIIDLIVELLKSKGLTRFCVDAGGDMFYYTQDNQALEVGLEHPDNQTQVIGIANITNQAIAGSSGNRRRWANFHHTINPTTLQSPNEIRAIWVIAESTLLADALTTCLYFVPPQQLQKYQFEYCILYADYSVQFSEKFPATFF